MGLFADLGDFSPVGVPRRRRRPALVDVGMSGQLLPFPDLPLVLPPAVRRRRPLPRELMREHTMRRLLEWVHFCPATSCWLCALAPKKGGYCRTHFAHDGRGQMVHRFFFEYHRGPIPEGLDVLHRCDVPPCCNPDHLFLGNDADNVRDCMAKGRFGRRPRGVEQSQAKLCDAAVRVIRCSPDVSHAEMARRYGVSVSAIKFVRSGERWRHVV